MGDGEIALSGIPNLTWHSFLYRLQHGLPPHVPDGNRGENSQMHEEKSSIWSKLVDEETGLYNRLYLVHHLNESYARARRYNTPLSCILLQTIWWRNLEEFIQEDSDPSSAIREIAQFLLQNVRTGDILGRWATNEFLLVTSCTPPKFARLVVKNLSKKLENYEFLDPPDLTVSFRAGVSGLPDDEYNVRYAENLPLIAHNNLEPIFQATPPVEEGCSATKDFKPEGSENRGSGGCRFQTPPARSPIWI